MYIRYQLCIKSTNVLWATLYILYDTGVHPLYTKLLGVEFTWARFVLRRDSRIEHQILWWGVVKWRQTRIGVTKQEQLIYSTKKNCSNEVKKTKTWEVNVVDKGCEVEIVLWESQFVDSFSIGISLAYTRHRNCVHYGVGERMKLTASTLKKTAN